MQVTGIRVKAGVTFVAEHFSPDAARIARVILTCAPETRDGFVWITEGWRVARHPRDLHAVGLAFDFRIHNLTGATHEARLAQARAWVHRCRQAHADRRYQFEIHGAKPEEFHIHAEFDTR
jgi:hypothetical protein